MKLYQSKLNTKKIQEHQDSVFYEYDLPFNKMAVGVSELNGRYPKSGFDIDTQVEQVWYVESGSGKIYLQEHVYEVSSGDMLLIPKNEKFWIDGNKVRLVVVSSPPWYAEQHKTIDK